MRFHFVDLCHSSFWSYVLCFQVVLKKRRQKKSSWQKEQQRLSKKNTYEFWQEKDDWAAFQLVKVVSFFSFPSPFYFPLHFFLLFLISNLDLCSVGLLFDFASLHSACSPLKFTPPSHTQSISELYTIVFGTIVLPLLLAATVLSFSGRQRICSVSGEGVFHI